MVYGREREGNQLPTLPYSNISSIIRLHYFIFSQMSVVTLLLPSPENRAGSVV
jgi:hypothetical protein